MQVIALSREKNWGKKIFFFTNPRDSTYNLYIKENNDGEMVPYSESTTSKIL